MKPRDAVLAYEETQSSDSSTKTIDLNITEPISAFQFEFAATNGATSNQNNPLHRCITNIELVDGGTVIANGSFEELQAIELAKTGKQPMLRIDETGSDYNVIGLVWTFGRYLYDTEYALDLSRYNNPKLKITWNLGAVRAVSATTAFATGTFRISVTAKVMEGLGGGAGKMLSAKRIDSWTSGTSGDRRIDLPLDGVYSLLLLRAYVAGNDVNENISNIKITADTDAFILMDRNAKEFRSEMAQVLGTTRVHKVLFQTSNDTVWVPLQHEPQVTLMPIANNVIPFANWAWSGNFALSLYNYSNSAITSDTEIKAFIHGYGLHSTIPIPIGDLMKPETWFDPSSYKKLEAVLTEAAAATCSIVAVQVK